MDKIKIINLKLHGHHGVLPEEKTLGQEFIVSVEMELDLQRAAMSAKLDKTVHYGILCGQIAELFKTTSHDLIESVGEEIAGLILSDYPQVKSATVEVKKPMAPIPQTLDYVSITVKRERHRAFIAYGSNLGEREKNITTALDSLANHPSIEVLEKSSTIETKPWGVTDQTDFLNGVVLVETWLKPEVLMDALLEIEAECGRERTEKWGPRTLDLDLLFYDELILDDPHVTLPHPLISDRAFVLEPLAEIAPGFVHPVIGKRVSELLAELERREDVEA